LLHLIIDSDEGLARPLVGQYRAEKRFSELLLIEPGQSAGVWRDKALAAELA
jgi:hypothetical protein